MTTTGKTAVTVAILVSLSAAPAAGQMTLGFRGGMNVARMALSAGGSSLTAGTRSSIHGAVEVGFVLKPGFSIEAPVTYVGKGFDPGASGSGVDGTLKLGYLEFPVLAVLTVPANPSLIAGRVSAGPALALRTRCTYSSPTPDATNITSCDADVSKILDFSVLVGVGLKIGRGKRGVTLDVGYDYGLMNVLQADVGGSAKNRNLLFSVGFIVPII
jgi:hypothetical protein